MTTIIAIIKTKQTNKKTTTKKKPQAEEVHNSKRHLKCAFLYHEGQTTQGGKITHRSALVILARNTKDQRVANKNSRLALSHRMSGSQRKKQENIQKKKNSTGGHVSAPLADRNITPSFLFPLLHQRINPRLPGSLKCCGAVGWRCQRLHVNTC